MPGIALILILISLFSASALGRKRKEKAEPPPGFVSAIERVKKSIVPVVCVDLKSDGLNKEPSVASVEGTGIFISANGAFLTAAHVIEGIVNKQRAKPCAQPAFYIPKSGWVNNRRMMTVEFFWFDPAACTSDKPLDLAICRSNHDFKAALGIDPLPIDFAELTVPEGTPVAFTGFPLQYLMPISSEGIISGYLVTDESLGPNEFLMDKAAWPGASGSPVFTVDGKVIGVVLRRGTGDGAGLSLGRTAPYVQAFIRAAIPKAP